MERQELIGQIVLKVQEKLSQRGLNVTPEEIAACLAGACDDGACDANKPGLLVLTGDHGSDCHAVFDSPALKEKYRTGCALLAEYDIDLDDYETVVLFNFSNEVLAKLYSGMGDTPYTALAMKALLAGKKLYVIREEVELFRYKETAPAPYYQMMKKQLSFLVECGLNICCRDKIEDVLLGNVPAEKKDGKQECAAKTSCDVKKEPEPVKAPVKEKKEISISKKVITERDVMEAERAKVTCIHVRENAILTDLAKDAAARRDIAIVRE